ncbi:MAG: DUF167 family protein [Gammaproteobacteria bacterium]|jgi:uncharacterized protein (TIGR00251 family)
MKKFYSVKNDKIILQIYLQPGAKTSEIVGMHGDYLKIKVKAPAIEGKANDALVKFLAQKFSVACRDVILTKGKQSRYKHVVVNGIDDLPGWLIKLTNSIDNC